MPSASSRLERLTAAHDAAASGQIDACVEALRNAWLHGAHSALVPLLDTALQRSTHLGVPATLERDIEKQWSALASRKRTPQVLLQLAQTPWPRQPGAAVSRVRALVKGPKDVLVTVALFRLITIDPYESERGDKAIRTALRALFGWSDPTAEALLKHTTSRHRNGASSSYGDLMRRRATPSVAFTAEEDKVVTKLTALLAPRAQSTDHNSLFAAILKAPHDFAARAVFADALNERGDPRGEFITLQLEAEQHALSAPQQRREKALVLEHGRTWLGELAPFVERRSAASPKAFRAGFPARVEVIRNLPADAFAKTEHWATIEELVIPRAPFMLHKHLRGLRSLSGVTRLTRQSDEPVAIEHLAMHRDVKDLESSNLSNLTITHLELHYTEDSPPAVVANVLSKHAWGQRIRAVTTWAIPKELADIPLLFEQLPHLERLTTRILDSSVESLTIERVGAATMTVMPTHMTLEESVRDVVAGARLESVRLLVTERASSRGTAAYAARRLREARGLLAQLGVAVTNAASS